MNGKSKDLQTMQTRENTIQKTCNNCQENFIRGDCILKAIGGSVYPGNGAVLLSIYLVVRTQLVNDPPPSLVRRLLLSDLRPRWAAYDPKLFSRLLQKGVT